MSPISTAQITGTNFAYQQVTFEKFLDDMVELEREKLELWGIAPHLHIPEFTFGQAQRMRRQLAERGLGVHCITPEQVMYPINVASSVEWLRDSSVDMFRKAAEVCVELEAPLLFLTPGRGFENESRDEAWKRAVDAIAGIAGYAASLGVDCVLEPLQRVESNLVNSAEELGHMLDEISAPNLGVALDTVAMATAGDSVKGYFDKFGALVKHVHLIDGRPAGHMVWGDGELPLAEYLEALSAADYSGYMSFEIFGGQYSLEPLKAHKRSYAAVERALAA